MVALHSMIGYCHHTVVCPSVCPSVGDAAHFGVQGQCMGLAIVPSYSYRTAVWN